MKIYFAADHAGFDLKSVLMQFVQGTTIRGVMHEAVDCGAFELDKADDYTDFVGRASKLLSDDAAAGVESRAVVIGASGQGEAMAANRFPKVRCALYYGEPAKKQTDMSGHELDMLSSSRQHNGANALSLGARFLSIDEAKQAVLQWLSAEPAAEDRHLRRIAKLGELPASAEK
ncbi:RpiB/LacA/LacB family sugar-phosphate isomerase [Candidatus Kaiserbacteria bacterium]|nr:RpiB/LacA/LacB family sugar-phosphate isomerase [Candidatus Kaiserbacteria bacterium]